MTQRLLSVSEFKARGLPPGANAVDDTVLGALLDEASGAITSYLRKRYTPPYSAWGDDVKRAVGAVARLYLLERRGFTGTTADQPIIDASVAALAWARDVATGTAEAEVTDSTGVEEATPLASFSPALGWATGQVDTDREVW